MTDSSSFSIKNATVEIQGTFGISEEMFKLLANTRRNQPANIKISIKKHQTERINIIQVK
ncbi:hypothetical protein AHAS_Ahas17G0044900 [Arachis hypogaea]